MRPVSLHSHSRCWLHLIWGTRDRERILHKEARARLSQFLAEHAEEKKIYMRINYVNADLAWGRGYGAFSVSESNVGSVAKYIASQEEHHRVRTFSEELKEFIDRHGLKWRSDESR